MGSIARNLSLCLWVAMPLAAASACEEAPSRVPSVRSDAEVNLPAPPSLAPRPKPAPHADGSLSVEGLLSRAAVHVGQEVTVRGKVVDVIDCPKAAKPDAPCHPPPHLYLADRSDAQRHRLLVTGWEAERIRAVRPGQELTFHGRFDLVTPDGTFIRQAGLLIVSTKP